MDFISRYYTVGIVFISAVTLVFLWLLCFRKRLCMTAAEALGLSFLSVFTGLLFLVLFYAFEGVLVGSPKKFGGFSLFGAVFLMPLAFWLGAKISKRKMSDIFDIFAIPMIIAMMCARINCLVTGCCTGLPISGTRGLYWPVREAELLYYLVFVLVFAPRVLKGTSGGKVFPWYMLSYGIVRFILQTFRFVENTNSMFNISHIWAVISFCIGLTVLIELKEFKKRRR